jgi:hypothetical protein
VLAAGPRVRRLATSGRARSDSGWKPYRAVALCCENSAKNWSGRIVNGYHFQLAVLAYNLNRWPMLLNREPQADATALRHTTLTTWRLRFLFVAAKIWRHAGRTGVSYSDHYEEKSVFHRLMDRLRRIVPRAASYAPALR